jgi:tetratricopeptide (TPR) repeat protein
MLMQFVQSKLDNFPSQQLSVQLQHEQLIATGQLAHAYQGVQDWEAAKDAYSQVLNFAANSTLPQEEKMRIKAISLHNLGVVAGEQRQWAAAEGYYKEALGIKIDFKDRYSQASTLHQLGMLAGEQREWAAAEGYHKEALGIYVDFNDRYEQGSTLHNLGVVAGEQREWAAAAQYGLEAAEIFVQYQDQHNLDIVLRGLARTWRDNQDAGIPRKLGELLDLSSEESEALLAQYEDARPE